MPAFTIVSDLRMTGGQPQAMRQLSNGIREGVEKQTLLGVTGSGKTSTMANILQEARRPTLVIAHNKTLAGQRVH
jgi:excinuclease ABC subunit B